MYRALLEVRHIEVGAEPVALPGLHDHIILPNATRTAGHSHALHRERRTTKCCGVRCHASRITFGSVGAFTTRVPGAVALYLMCGPCWRRFVLFHVFEL